MSLRAIPIRPHYSWLSGIHRLSDAAAIVAALWLAIQVTGHGLPESIAVVAAIGVGFYVACAELTGIYRNWRGIPLRRELSAIAITCLWTSLALLGFAFLFRQTGTVSRALMIAWCGLAPTLIGGARTVLRLALQTLRARGLNTKGFAVVGVNELGIQLARNIEGSPRTRTSVGGVL